MFGRLVAIAGVTVVATGSLQAQSATQVVQFQVTAVNQIAVTGNPAPIVINSAVAGAPTAMATTGGTSYAISTNESNQKITASIDAAMPAGLSLAVQLGAPTGATSAGQIALTTSGSDLVTGISRTAASALPISYQLTADATASIATASRVVTFTIVSGA